MIHSPFVRSTKVIVRAGHRADTRQTLPLATFDASWTIPSSSRAVFCLQLVDVCNRHGHLSHSFHRLLCGDCYRLCPSPDAGIADFGITFSSEFISVERLTCSSVSALVAGSSSCCCFLCLAADWADFMSNLLFGSGSGAIGSSLGSRAAATADLDSGTAAHRHPLFSSSALTSSLPQPMPH